MTDWICCDVHFGLFSVYEWPNDFREGMQTDHVRRHARDVLNCSIATSRHGDSWDLTSTCSSCALAERGTDRAWDKDMILPANWIVTHDNVHWIDYGGANERHGTGGVFEPKRDGGHRPRCGWTILSRSMPRNQKNLCKISPGNGIDPQETDEWWIRRPARV